MGVDSIGPRDAHRGAMDDAAITPMRRLMAFVAAALGAAAAVWFYWPALGAFFASDDWVVLHHYGPIPPAQWWRYFDTDTIWFYRPLQSLQFGLMYHVFGLNEWAFNAALLIMHLGVLALAWGLARAMMGSGGFAACVTLLFATSWVYVDILLWKANYNSLQWAACSLGACLALQAHLNTGRRGMLWLCWGLCAANFFTKEMAVNLPVLLLLVLARHDAGTGVLREGWRGAAGRAVRILAVPAVMTILYVAAHTLLINNIEPYFKPGYRFVGPLEAARNTLHAINHVFLAPLAYPMPRLLGLSPDGPLSTIAGWPLAGLLVLPAAVIAAGMVLRDLRIMLGVAWIVGSFLPALFLDSYHASRFYYLPAFGGALSVAALAAQLWTRASASPREAVRGLRFLSPAIVAAVVAANSLQTQSFLAYDAEGSRAMRRLFEFLGTQGEQIPPDSMIVLVGTSDDFLNGGLGAREMIQMALGRNDVEGAVEGQDMEPGRIAELKTRSHHFMVDFRVQPLKLVKLPEAANTPSPAPELGPDGKGAPLN